MTARWRVAFGISAAVLLVVAVIAAYAVVVWQTFDAERRAALASALPAPGGTLVVLLLVLGAAIGLALAPLIRSSILAPLRLAQATRLIATANASHRIPTEGRAEIQELGAAINLLASRYEDALREARARTDAGRASLEQEKNRLAALMSELTYGVIVCNIEGAVLLYNNAARSLFSRFDDVLDKSLIGLGRSVFSLIDRTLVAHGLTRIEEQLRRGIARPVVHFAASTPSGELVRLQLAPIPAQRGGLDGYILTFAAAGRELAFMQRGEDLLQSLAESGRAALSNVRTAAEAMDQAGDRRERGAFMRVIREETDALAKRLEQAARAYATDARAQWPLEDMPCGDLIALAAGHVAQAMGVAASVERTAEAWIRVDSYVMLHALAWLALQLREVHQADAVYFRAETQGRHVALDVGAHRVPLAQPGPPDWETLAISDHGELARRTMRQVMERHGGQAWQHADATGEVYFRLLLPLAEPPAATGVSDRVHESRPEFYDFDLFHQAGQSAALENRRLADLSYTVFDTETTGLNPSQGDEIIAIGAVRIVNARMLSHEAFEQLVDPRRPLSPGSARITGIDADMLKGQPTIEAVLPLFRRYCADTVMVAHNAAFDMRFLQVKERATGVRFTQPVLDTLLLSAVLHPALEQHSLESIAARHGVPVIGRHTALGDAMLTAEIFLKMIPQLAERGIVTLKDAEAASQRTYYARVRY